MTDLAPGAALSGGRYLLDRRIGTGGMAAVWLAADERLDRDVAIKVIAANLVADPDYVARFAREARVAASLSHPNLVKVFDYGSDEQRPFLVMEYVEGGSLARRLADGRWSPLDTPALARELLDALGHIHDAGIVHRDIKPANVLVGLDGRSRLGDFGIAHPDDATRLTATGAVIGTARYLSPEVQDGEAATQQSDLYALGVLLLECEWSPSEEAMDDLVDWLTAPDVRERAPSAAAALELLGDAGTPARPQAVPPATTAPPARAQPPAPGPAPAPDRAPGPDRAPAPDRTTGRDRAPGPATAPAEPRKPRETPAVVKAARRRLGELDPRILGGAAAAVLVVVVALLIATGGDDAPTTQVPFDRQEAAQRLDELEREIRAAGGR